MNFETKQFYLVHELKNTEKQEILDLTDYYSKIVTKERLTERKLLALLRQTSSSTLSQFLSQNILELINNFRNEKIPLLLFQGELFDKSMPLKHTEEFVGTKVLLPQEVLAITMSSSIGHPFGIQGERLEMVQRGAKIAHYTEGKSVSGTAERGFHVDNPQRQCHMADDLFFMLNNSHGVNTKFSAVLVDELSCFRVGNYSLLEILRMPNFETTATLNCLQDKPRIHSVVSNFDKKFAGLLLNENTIPQQNIVLNTGLSNRQLEIALQNLRDILEQNSIDIPYNLAFVSQKSQSVLHAVQEIPDDRKKEVCADPSNPDYLKFRELIRIYSFKDEKSENWVPKIEGLESLSVTGTNVVA